jgi:hypothetical protein
MILKSHDVCSVCINLERNDEREACSGKLIAYVIAQVAVT